MTRGREGVWIPPKSDDVIYEQPLNSPASDNENIARIADGALLLCLCWCSIDGDVYLGVDTHLQKKSNRPANMYYLDHLQKCCKGPSSLQRPANNSDHFQNLYCTGPSSLHQAG